MKEGNKNAADEATRARLLYQSATDKHQLIENYINTIDT